MIRRCIREGTSKNLFKMMYTKLGVKGQMVMVIVVKNLLLHIFSMIINLSFYIFVMETNKIISGNY